MSALQQTSAPTPPGEPTDRMAAAAAQRPLAAPGETAPAPDLGRAQIASLARFTPINSLVTLCASLLTAAILWPAAPQGWVAAWAAALTLPALYLLLRWLGYRRRKKTMHKRATRKRARPSAGWANLRLAECWSAVSGGFWGSGALFLPHVPAPQQLALIIVTAAIAGGATTTLAALPRAAALFIAASLLPYAVWFMLQGDPVHLGLAMMALAMTVAMLGSTRIVHAAFVEDLKNRQANVELVKEFENAQQEWLDISDTAEAFALYDGDDRLLLWNKSLPELLSIDHERLYRGLPRAEARQLAARPVDQAGDPAADADGAGDTVRRLENGRWIRTHERRTSQGHSAVMHVDVTELMVREQALLDSEETLRRREQYFRALIENTSDIISLVGPDGTLRFQSAAAEAALGYAPEEVHGISIFTLIHEDDMRAIGDRLPRLVHRPGAVGSAEVRVRHKDGSWRTLAAIARNALDVPGVEGIVVNSRDITELKQREDQLRQAQKMEAVGQLTGGVAHDFNNLLTAIIGNLEMACLHLDDDNEVRPLIEIASRAAERGATLTQHLLAFARRQPLTPERVDVGELLANMSALLERTLGSDIEIALDVADGLWPVRADASQLQNAILNLAINARDAMPDGGRLTISAGNRQVTAGSSRADGNDDSGPPGGDYVAVSVADTGTGMTEETLKRAFEPFFTTKEVGRGSGLGLSMVFGFAKQSGGHASAESRPGDGTTIRLLLPRAEAADDTGEPRDEKDEVAANALAQPGSTTLLLVEDDADVRMIAVAALTRAGYAVLAAGDGEQALALLEQQPKIDLLFTDVLLPGGMTGRDIAMVARQRNPDLPVLFASGYPRETLSEQGRLLPGIDLLQKPYTARVLLERINQAVSCAEDADRARERA